MQVTFERRLNEIRKGIYSFREIGNVETKKQMAAILVDEYNNGTITDEALKSLVDYYVDQINIFKRIKIEDVPNGIKELVSKKL